jgi:hypothetical protein
MSYLIAARQNVEQAADVFKHPPTGVDEVSREDVARALGHGLPAAYDELLAWLGENAAGILGDARPLIGHWKDNAQDLSEVLEANELSDVTAGEVCVFFCDEGGRLAWFDLPVKSDDPPVTSLYLDDEVTRDDLVGHNSLSAFVAAVVDDVITARRQAPPAPRFDDQPMVTLAQFPSALEADLHRATLEEAGIPAFVVGHTAQGVTPFVTDPYGVIRLQVRADDLKRAQEVLSRTP